MQNALDVELQERIGVLPRASMPRLPSSWISPRSSTPAAPGRCRACAPAPTGSRYAGVLSGETPGGRSRIEDGPWLSPAVVRRLSCDADVVTVTERDGLPIDVGRVRRLITPRLRLALQSRDHGCRFPGCSVPASRTDGHHIEHWSDGGKTNLDNLVHR
jgi:Domain of unknown function (DUF222)